MSAQTQESTVARDGSITEVDALIVGAGFGGLRMLHEARQLGLSTLVLEAGTEVGGTWYWNRYPGARTDSESWYYCYYFDKELKDEWDWNERFSTQSDVFNYLKHVADKFDMRRDIRFDSRVDSAVYDESANRWLVTTTDGRQFSCTYFMAATGVLSHPYVPDFPGIDTFEGESYQTARWPEEKISFSGKRVAVIGAGATAVQAIPLIAQTAEHLTVFQRTPNFVLPARNHTLTDHHREGIKDNYDAIFEQAKHHFFGMAIELTDRKRTELTDKEVEAVLDAGWENGGFRFIFQTFDDIWTNEDTNAVVADYVRKKIRTIVTDPETAEKLCPKGYPLGSKRPPLGHFYYETYNRPNVDLVDVSETPITEITPRGIKVGDTEYEVDVIVYATGFDSVTGSFTAMDIRGRDGLTLADAWKDGPRTVLGIAIEGFPNMFMVMGPEAATANVPIVVEGIAEWISAAINYMRDHDADVFEATTEAEVAWKTQLLETLSETLIVQGGTAIKHNQYFGTNIPGKANAPQYYFGGAGPYFEWAESIANNNYMGFKVSRLEPSI